MQISQNKRNNKFIADFLLGGVSAGFIKTAVAPLERIKILLQTQEVIAKIHSNQIPKFNGILNCFKRTVVSEGPLALWRGNAANLIRCYPSQALNLAFRGVYNRWFCLYHPKKEPIKFFLGNLASGGAAAASSLIFIYPFDFLRTRLAADLGRTKVERDYLGLRDCIVKIYKTDGIGGFYQGFMISVVGMLVYSALYLGLFETGKSLLFEDPTTLSIQQKFAFANIVTIFAGVVSYPFDTVQRRLMLQAGRKSDTLYSGTADCFKKIYSNEGGYRGFMKGGLCNVYRWIGTSLVLVAYDEVFRIFEKKSE